MAWVSAETAYADRTWVVDPAPTPKADEWRELHDEFCGLAPRMIDLLRRMDRLGAGAVLVGTPPSHRYGIDATDVADNLADMLTGEWNTDDIEEDGQ